MRPLPSTQRWGFLGFQPQEVPSPQVRGETSNKPPLTIDRVGSTPVRETDESPAAKSCNSRGFEPLPVSCPSPRGG